MKSRINPRYLLWLCMAGLLTLTSCGGKFFPAPCKTNCATTNSGNYLYVANSSTSVSSIAGFTIANSALSTLSNSPYGVGVPPNALAITPGDTYVYASSLSGGIFAYTINSDGTLSIANGGSAVVQNLTPMAMKVDPTGKWLIVADLTPSVYVFSIDSSTGALTPAGNAVGLDAGTVSNLYITPSGSYVFISLGTGGVDILTFNTNSGVIGLNQRLKPTSSGNADYGLASDPNSKYLFVTETGINALRILSINSTGSSILTELSNSPVKTGLGPSQVIVTRDGSYVYVTNRTDNTISGFTLAANGALTAISGSPYTTGTNPVDITEDKTGGYIAVACAGGNPDMQVFAIDTTTPGKLDAFSSKTTGTDPTLASAIVGTR